MSAPGDLPAVVAAGFADYYRGIQKRVHELVAPLSEEQLWRRPYSYGNSVGHLMRHVTGNLSYYIGARIAQTGYVRDRPREFTDSRGRPKGEVLAELDAAVAMVVATIDRQHPEDWLAPYTAEGEEPCDRFTLVLRCAAHAHHHVGQMIYLCKQLREQSQTVVE